MATKTKTMSFRVTESIYNDIIGYCKRNNVAVTDVLRLALMNGYQIPNVKAEKPKADEINHLRICLGMVGIASNNRLCDLILETQKKMRIFGGNFSLKDAVELETANEKKYTEVTKK